MRKSVGEGGGAILGELGIPLSGMLALTAGVGLFVEGIHKAMEPGRQAAEVNHVLAS